MSETYAATRIHVMHTKLIQPQEYERLLKMSDSEVINFLQGTEYRKDVDALDIKDLEDLEMIDRIISLNSARTLKKLERITSKTFSKALAKELRKNDFWNLVVIAEALTGETDPKHALEQYGKKGTIDASEFLDVKNLQELSRKAAKYFKEFKKEPKDFSEFLHRVGSASRHSFLRTDRYIIDEQNIVRIVKFKRENIPPNNIPIEKGGTVAHSLLVQAANAKDVQETLELLRGTSYKKVMERAITHLKEGSLVRFEDELHREILHRIRKETRRYPLGVELLTYYLAEKDVEHENLRLLIKGKRLGLEEPFIREYLAWN